MRVEEVEGADTEIPIHPSGAERWMCQFDYE